MNLRYEVSEANCNIIPNVKLTKVSPTYILKCGYINFLELPKSISFVSDDKLFLDMLDIEMAFEVQEDVRNDGQLFY